MWHPGPGNFMFFQVVPETVPKKSKGTGTGKFGTKKSTGIGNGKIWYRKFSFFRGGARTVIGKILYKKAPELY